MGSKAEYEAKKAAKLAKRADEEAAQWQAVTEGYRRKDAVAPVGDDEELRYPSDYGADDQAYAAAGIARLTVHTLETQDDPIGRALLHLIFPDHMEQHTIGFSVTAKPGRIIAEDTWNPEDDAEVEVVYIRDIHLDVGEVVHACLYEPAGKGTLRCVERVLYPRIILPDGWQEALPSERGSFWAEEDLSDTFGIPVGGLIYGEADA